MGICIYCVDKSADTLYLEKGASRLYRQWVIFYNQKSLVGRIAPNQPVIKYSGAMGEGRFMFCVLAVLDVLE